MDLLKIYPTSINLRYIAEAAEAMRHGAIICYPTDTLYALGCDATNNAAIERLCRLKGINPTKNTLSVICDGLSQASEYARIDNASYRTIKDFIPGPFTFILPASSRLPKVFKGRRTVGIRIPDNEVARALAREMGSPVLSATAPASGSDGTDNPDEALESLLPDVSIMIDGGVTGSQGQPSTVIDLTDPTAPEIIRQGLGIWPE